MIVKAQPARISSAVTLTGEVRAQVQTDLGFQFAGRITSRNVDVGDHVEAGQELATLDDTQQTADVSAAKASVLSAQATLTQQTAAFERQKALLEKGFTTQSNYDDANEAARGAQASLDSAKAELASAEDRLRNTSLRADETGIIVSRDAEVGQVVDAAQTIFTLAKDGARDAVFNVYESLLTTPPADNQIEVSLLSNPSVKAVGKVREVAPAIDQSTGTVRVKISLEKTPPEMKLGSAVIGVGRFRERDVFELPWTAFFVEGGKPAVWIVDPESRAVSTKPVTVDSFQTGKLLISAGLMSGDLVVTAGVQLLRPGQIVSPQELPDQPGAGS